LLFQEVVNGAADQFGHGNVELFGEFLQPRKSGFRKKKNVCASFPYRTQKPNSPTASLPPSTSPA
jgi:hypothetical protein